MSRLLPLALGAATLLLTTAASAQDPITEDRAPTTGVDRPVHDYSGQGDASSMELNPALLSTAQGLDVVFRGYSAVSEFVRGSGFGGFVSANLRGIALGVGVQFVQPGFRDETFDFDAGNNFDMTKLTFALSGGDPRYGSVGLAVSGIRRNGGRLQQPDLDLGALVRMTNYASLGFSARLAPVDLAPAVTRSEAGLVGELALRPLGTRHFELAGGVRARLDRTGDAEEAGPAILPRARAALRWRGWSLSGQVEQVQAVEIDETTLGKKADVRAWRGSVALGLSWDFVSAEAGTHLGLSGGVDGVGYMARFSSRRQGRVYWARKVDAERLDLSEVTDERSLIAMLEQIRRAERAGDRSVVLVDARDVGVGYASLQELRTALARVRNAGGHVFAYVEQAGMAEYYLASVAEQVYIHPAGELSIFGLKSTGMYFKDAMAKLGVRVDALHIREYKSAPERFSRSDRSEYDRKQRTELLADTYDVFVSDVAQARKLTKSQIRALVDGAPYGPAEAIENGLADEKTHRDEIVEKISEKIGASVSFSDFSPTEPADQTWSTEPYIAVILVEGGIVDGKGRSLPILNLNNTGGDTIIQELREARSDRACKGIILRVNSPGGSALASEIIWREVSKTQAEHEKDPRSTPPIIVSMGDYAASGGYYVSTGAKKVLAQETTITGSIGVFAMHFDVSGLLKMLGINIDTIAFGKNADIDSLYKPYSEQEWARMEASIQRTYDLFRKRVADARGMDMDKVDEIGRGHVYSGRDAKEIKLVDEFGGLREAIDWVRDESGVGRRFALPLRVLPEKKGLLGLLLENSGPIIEEPATRAQARRQAARKPTLPLALEEAIARFPLSFLFMPQDRANLVMDSEIRIE